MPFKSAIKYFHSFGEHVQGTANLCWNTLACILANGSWYCPSIALPSKLLKNCLRVSYSPCSRQSTLLLLGKILLSFSLRASQPQSIPVASLNHSTAFLIPVASVIFSISSPRPLLFFTFGLAVLFVRFLVVFFDFCSDIF